MVYASDVQHKSNFQPWIGAKSSKELKYTSQSTELSLNNGMPIDDLDLDDPKTIKLLEAANNFPSGTISKVSFLRRKDKESSTKTKHRSIVIYFNNYCNVLIQSELQVGITSRSYKSGVLEVYSQVRNSWRQRRNRPDFKTYTKLRFSRFPAQPRCISDMDGENKEDSYRPCKSNATVSIKNGFYSS